MTPRTWELVKAAFAEASEAPPDERPAIIERLCAGKPEAAAEVRRMLAFANGEPPVQPPRPARLPRTIGRFEIIELIGSGATGIVYRARDARSGQPAAVKVLRLAIASHRAVRRLEYEGEVLSRLDHPGIARVFETGATDTEFGSLPYIAMELVEGEPIDAYAERHALDDPARIRLTARVCEAIGYAHRRGVIHRDVKPANILVDRAGNPKILDFGIARSISDDLRATTLLTPTGEVLGTPGYMSPEQCAGASDLADTRADVYALGVVLYELLARERLCDVRELPILAAIEVMARAEAPLIGATCPHLRGAVEAVLAKAMHHDPRRRYESAALLAEDLRRLLAGEVVSAEPVSTAFRIRRYIRHHHTPLVAACSIITALSLALAVLWRAYAREEARSRVAECSLLIVTSGELATAHTRLDMLLEHLPGARLSSEHKRVMFDHVGLTFLRLGDTPQAIDLYADALHEARHALGPDHQQTIRSLQIYAEALSTGGRADEAEQLCRQELERWAFTPETRSPRADQSQNNRLLRLAMTHAEALSDLGRYGEAIQYLERVLAAQRAFFGDVADSHTDIADTEALLMEARRLRQAAATEGPDDGP